MRSGYMAISSLLDIAKSLMCNSVIKAMSFLYKKDAAKMAEILFTFHLLPVFIFHRRAGVGGGISFGKGGGMSSSIT